MLQANWLSQGAPDLIWEAPAGDLNVWDHRGLEAVTFTSWQHGPWGCHLHITLHHPKVQPHSGNATTFTRLEGSIGEGQVAAVVGTSHQEQVIPLHQCQVHSKTRALQGEVVKLSAPCSDHSERE